MAQINLMRTFITMLLLMNVINVHATVEPLNLREMTERADKIVLAKVIKSRSAWQTEERRIQTTITFQIEGYIKGSGPEQITVTLPGGQVGDITEVVSDVPTFSLDERAVLYLQNQSFPLVGWHQGKVVVVGDRVVGEEMNLPDYIYKIRKMLPSSASLHKKLGRLELQDFPEPVANDSLRTSSSLLWIPNKGQNGNPSTVLEKQNAIAGWTSILSESFESGASFPGSSWRLSANHNGMEEGYGYTWEIDDFKSHSGTASAWCAKAHVKSGKPNLDPAVAKYPNSLDAWMIYGPFNLSDAVEAKVQFYYWNESESHADYFKWYASTNGSQFSGYQVSGSSNGWQVKTFDLTSVPTLGNVCGQAQVWIAFAFSGNSGTTFTGAFVDDITISKYVQTEADPQILSVTPTSASAGTNSLITITGTNFGTVQAAGKVEFFYRSGQPTVSAPITSWNDTQIVCTVPIAKVNGYPASAGSGPLKVTNGEGLSAVYNNFIVTFGYGDAKWPGSHPLVNYYINENTLDCSGEGLALIQAANEWNQTGDANFGFHIAGTSSATSSSHNSLNECFWGTTSGSIATTTYWYNGSKEILECDIVFNDGYDWGHGSGAFFDVQNIATHELGHWLNLRDLYGNIGDGMNDNGKTLYGFGAQNETIKQTLSAADVAGIRWIYGSNNNEQPAITLLTPGEGNTNVGQGQSYTVLWTDSDPDNNATITLAYDSDAAYWNADQSIIASGLSEDADGNDGHYDWNTAGVAPGAYTLWAMVQDGVNPPVYSVAVGTITIRVESAVSDLRASIQNGFILLEWSGLTGVTQYNVYRGTSYDFIPSSANRIGTGISDQDGSRTGVQFTDNDIDGANVVGDVQTNYFYKVAGLNPSEGSFSNVAGEYDFDLITTAGTDINEIVVLFNTQNTLSPIANAEELATAIPNCTNVYYWNPSGQGSIGHPKGTPINNFLITPGHPYMLNVTVDGVWTVAGSYQDLQFSLITTAGTDINHITVPLAKSLLTDAELLAQDIPSGTNVYYWDVSGQGTIGHPKGTPINTFAVKVGYPYYVNVMAESTWPTSLQKHLSVSEDRNPFLRSGTQVGGTPHTAFGRVIMPSSLQGVPVPLQLRAWIIGRENEWLTQASLGSYVDQGYWAISVGNFPTAWQAGDRLHVELYSEAYSLKGELTIRLTTEGSDQGEIVMTMQTEITGAGRSSQPTEVTLLSNYPNPFNPSTEIQYGLPQAMKVTITIYDISGRIVKTLISKTQAAGFHQVSWDGTDDHGVKVGSGVYLCHLLAGGRSQMSKLIIAK